MWLMDYAEDFSLLKADQIRQLIKKGILNPAKEKGAYQFSFQDVLIMRTFKLLRANGVSYLNATRAYDYLRTWPPEESLTSLQLYHDEKEVYVYNETDQAVNATRYGQLALPQVKNLLQLSAALEETRRAMLSEAKHLRQLAQKIPKNTVPAANWRSWIAS
jgi:DNA-binding transcriptional MerR regulator